MTTNAERERALLRTARALFLANVLYVISHPLYIHQRDMKTNKVKKKILRRRRHRCYFYSATSSTFTEYKSAKIRLFSESARQGRAKKEKETFSHCAPRSREEEEEEADDKKSCSS
jgi:hypothetical protein